MVWAGELFAHNLDFSAGSPTGAVIYSVLGNDDLPLSGLDAVSVTPVPGSISHLIIIPGSAHTVATALFEKRTLIWSYTNATGAVNGRLPYRVEKPLPFPVSNAGVKAKLGLMDDEIGDEFINLTKAYAMFAEAVALGDLASYEDSGDLASLKIIDAIEAVAAMAVLGKLQVLVTRSEESGTNAFSRFSEIDWELLRGELQEIIDQGLNLVVPPDNELAGITVFFAIGPTTDPFTGESA